MCARHALAESSRIHPLHALHPLHTGWQVLTLTGQAINSIRNRCKTHGEGAKSCRPCDSAPRNRGVLKNRSPTEEKIDGKET